MEKDEMSELESLVNDAKPEEAPDESALKTSTIAYQAAIVIIDGLTAATIAMISYWYYGVIWFLAGAISFFLHHKNWDAPLNNEKQIKNSQTGMIVAVASMVVMALAAASVWVLKYQSPYIEAGIVLPVIGLFFWNALQVALYRFESDKFVMNRAIARAKANAHKHITIAKAAGEVVAANRTAIEEKNRQYQRHGDRGAVDRAMEKMGAAKHGLSYASDTEAIKKDESNPTPRRSQ
jgi:hypothetical protein